MSELQNPDEFSVEGPERFDEKNIRRRVYDALNVLMAMNIIAKEKKARGASMVASVVERSGGERRGAGPGQHIKSQHTLRLAPRSSSALLRSSLSPQEIMWKGLPATETDEEHARGEKIRIATRIERKKAYLQARRGKAFLPVLLYYWT